MGPSCLPVCWLWLMPTAPLCESFVLCEVLLLRLIVFWAILSLPVSSDGLQLGSECWDVQVCWGGVPRKMENFGAVFHKWAGNPGKCGGPSTCQAAKLDHRQAEWDWQ